MTDLKKYPVITISREYAAGGRTIARAMAEKLNLKWYDKDLAKATAEASGYALEDINREGEELTTLEKVLETLTTTNYQSSHTGIYQAEKAEILELASQGPCIFVGRCANIILREAGIPSLDVYLYADEKLRLRRAAELKENGDTELVKYLQDRDRLRATFYKTYTKHILGDYHDFDLMLNTGLMGKDECMEIILDAYAKKQKELD